MVKKIAIGLLIVAGLNALAAVSVFAEEERYKKKTIIDFDEVLLEGELKKPAGAYITERSEKKFDNLIKVRTNFEKEMFKSVDVLK